MKRFFVIAIVLILSYAVVFAADSATHNVVVQIQNVCKINLNSTSTITLTTVAPAVGGNPVTGQSDSSKLLQYTSAAPSGQTRRITAAWGASDSAPAGTALRLQVTSVTSGCGTAGAQITLSSTAQNLVTAIGSCATGTGVNGAALTYAFAITNINNLRVGSSSTVTVTFTFTDAS
jgi:hypothetical protein